MKYFPCHIPERQIFCYNEQCMVLLLTVQVAAGQIMPLSDTATIVQRSNAGIWSIVLTGLRRPPPTEHHLTRTESERVRLSPARLIAGEPCRWARVGNSQPCTLCLTFDEVFVVRWFIGLIAYLCCFICIIVLYGNARDFSLHWRLIVVEGSVLHMSLDIFMLNSIVHDVFWWKASSSVWSR